MLRSLRLFRFTVAAAIALMASLAQAEEAAPEATKNTSSGSVVTDIQADAERVGEKATELGESAADAADGVADTATDRAKKAYEWTKKQGEDAYEWSKKKIQEITQ